MFQIGLKKFLWLKKLEILWRVCVISDLNGEETDGKIYEKELQKVYQKKFKVEKVIKRKDDKPHVKWNESEGLI